MTHNTSLLSIIERYSSIGHNENNYDIGGGMSDFGQSRRCLDAMSDPGKMTAPIVVAMFRAATGAKANDVKAAIEMIIPRPERHHVQSDSGRFSWVTFYTAQDIVSIAQDIEDHLARRAARVKAKKAAEATRQAWLEANATWIDRQPQDTVDTLRLFHQKVERQTAAGKWVKCPSYHDDARFSGWLVPRERMEEWVALI